MSLSILVEALQGRGNERMPFEEYLRFSRLVRAVGTVDIEEDGVGTKEKFGVEKMDNVSVATEVIKILDVQTRRLMTELKATIQTQEPATLSISGVIQLLDEYKEIKGKGDRKRRKVEPSFSCPAVSESELLFSEGRRSVVVQGPERKWMRKNNVGMDNLDPWAKMWKFYDSVYVPTKETMQVLVHKRPEPKIEKASLVSLLLNDDSVSKNISSKEISDSSILENNKSSEELLKSQSTITIPRFDAAGFQSTNQLGFSFGIPKDNSSSVSGLKETLVKSEASIKEVPSFTFTPSIQNTGFSFKESAVPGSLGNGSSFSGGFSFGKKTDSEVKEKPFVSDMSLNSTMTPSSLNTQTPMTFNTTVQPVFSSGIQPFVFGTTNASSQGSTAMSAPLLFSAGSLTSPVQDRKYSVPVSRKKRK